MSHQMTFCINFYFFIFNTKAGWETVKRLSTIISLIPEKEFKNHPKRMDRILKDSILKNMHAVANTTRPPF